MDQQTQTTKKERYKEILNEDLLRLEDIHAVMIATKHLEGIGPFIQPEYEHHLKRIWDTLEKTMDDFFDIIAHYSDYGLDKIYFELGEYDIIFFILPETDTALVAIVPALANRGLLEVELENARRRILEIMAQE
jgi:uncharacterized protein with GYD domain